MSGFSSTVHLVGHYPELARSSKFQSWLREHGGEFWHETHASEDGHVTVVVQSLDRLQLYAALIKRQTGEQVSDFKAEIVDTADIDLVLNGLTSRHAVLSLAAAAPAMNGRIQAVRPVVDFNKDPPQVSWEVEVTEDGHLEKFMFNAPNNVTQVDVVALSSLAPLTFQSPRPSDLPTNDWLEENELHHPSVLREEALSIVGNATTVFERAIRICVHVRDEYAYDSNISHIKDFTWSDLLVRFRLKRRGICDEHAIVQISFLRALGIPAVLKFLRFTFGGKPAAHACLEFLDNGQWIHMDAYNRTLNEPTIYRSLGWKNVTVMDASWPRDDRSTDLAWGAPDITGDGRLNPYNDFILTPAFPGERRPGYSH